MLACVNRTLPPEIYSSIFSHLKRRDLVQLSQACNILLSVTVPHIWREVQLKSLLALLPGACRSTGLAEPETPASEMSPEDYYARFALYAPHVKVLTLRDGFDPYTPSAYFMKHLERQPAGTFDQMKLPTLEEVNAHYSYFSMSATNMGLYRQSSLIWMVLMIPPTLKSLSFTAGNHQDLPLLSSLLTKCPQLTQFKFSPDQQPNWDTWGFISTLPVAQELTNLEVRCAETSTDGYLWLSKLPKLQYLKLYFGQHYGQLPQLSKPPRHHSVTFPQAFSSLRKLHISVGEELHHIIPVWRAIGAHVTHVTIETWNRTCTLDMFNRLFSSLVENCPKVSYFHLHEYVPTSVGAIGADAPRLPVLHLSTLQRLPLRVLRIDRPLAIDDGCSAMESVGTLFPRLEELWLENTPIKIDDLLKAKLYFSRLRCLRVCLHILKPTSEPLGTIIGDSSQYFDGSCALDSNLALELHTGAGLSGASKAYDETDWDFAASLLAACWSNVSIVQSWDGMMYQQFFKIDEKIAFHSARARSRRQERE